MFIHTKDKNNHHWTQWHSGILKIKDFLGAWKKKEGGERLRYQKGGRGSLCCSIFKLAEYLHKYFMRSEFALICCKATRTLTKPGTRQLQMLSKQKSWHFLLKGRRVISKMRTNMILHFLVVLDFSSHVSQAALFQPWHQKPLQKRNKGQKPQQ